MILLTLFLEFFKIGMFSFGGAYGAIPLIKESVLAQGWADEEMISNMIAISESTPGPIMVNTATYVGSTQAGAAGAAAATLGVILPSFLVLLLVTVFLQSLLKHKNVQAVLGGVKPCLMGVILCTGAFMACSELLGDVKVPTIHPVACGIFLFLILLSCVYRFARKKEISPIFLIIISAALGVLLYS